MNRTMRPRLLLLTAALGCALFATAPVLAQDSGSDTEVEATASVPKSRLVERYTELAGSGTAAASLIDTLRSGGDFTVSEQVTTTTTNPDGTTTSTTSTVERTVANPSGPMGWGGVNITLSLAQAMVDSGAYPDLQSALTGTTTTTTNADGTTTTTTTGGVLAMRADGMGWGAIAKELGFNLGSVVSGSSRNMQSVAAKERRSEARAERASQREERAARAERPERAQRPERAERPQRPERAERPQRPERPERGGGRP